MSNVTAGAVYVYGRDNTTASFVLLARLTASDGVSNENPTTGDWFGRHVSISSSGDTILVGAPFHDTAGLTRSGQAYIFEREPGNGSAAWAETAKLSRPHGAGLSSFDHCGTQVYLAADGQRALLSCPFASVGSQINAGRVLVFTRNFTGGWEIEAELARFDSPLSEFLSYSFACDANATVCALGAPFNSRTGLERAGGFYAFARNGTAWSKATTPEAVLLPEPALREDAGNQDSMGMSADGQFVVVGAYGPGGSEEVAPTGRAGVFRRMPGTDVYEAVAVLQPAVLSPNARFGYGVSLSTDGRYLVVGALLDRATDASAGSVYAFERFDSSGTAWSTRASRLVPVLAADRDFGLATALSFDGSVLAVGARSESLPVPGSAHVFATAESATTRPNDQPVDTCSPGYGGYFCGLCAAGTYSNAAGTACVACPPSSTTTGAGASSLDRCLCGGGRFLNATAAGGLGLCGTCPAGAACPNGATEPESCASTPGAYCPAGSSEPLMCSVGSFCPSPDIEMQCDPGYACDMAGLDAPVPCAAGFYCPGSSVGFRAVLCPAVEGLTCPALSPSPIACSTCGNGEIGERCTSTSDTICAEEGNEFVRVYLSDPIAFGIYATLFVSLCGFAVSFEASRATGTPRHAVANLVRSELYIFFFNLNTPDGRTFCDFVDEVYREVGGSLADAEMADRRDVSSSSDSVAQGVRDRDLTLKDRAKAIAKAMKDRGMRTTFATPCCCCFCFQPNITKIQHYQRNKELMTKLVNSVK